MTMPHLENCRHIGDGWCLSCVREMYYEMEKQAMPDSARHVGENRRKVKFCRMTVEVSVCVEWPEGVPFSEDTCREIAAGAVAQRWDRDVGPVGKIVWAKCSSDCTDEDVTIDEVFDM